MIWYVEPYTVLQKSVFWSAHKKHPITSNTTFVIVYAYEYSAVCFILKEALH